MTSTSISRPRRDFLKLAVGASAAVTAAGCGVNLGGGGNAGGGSGDLVVASFYALDKERSWVSMVKAFEEKHPGVKIRTQVTTKGYLEKVLAQKASRTMPDVLGVENSTMFPYFQSKGVLQDLTSRLAEDKDFNKSLFYPKILDRYTVNGQVYGIPYDAQPVCGAFINKKLFADGGIAVPTGDWTWAEMTALAKRLTKREGGRTVQYGLDPAGNWTNWVYAYGGRAVDDVGHPTEVLFDSPEAIRGMQEYVDLITQGVAPAQSGLSKAGLTSVDLFVTGRVAMSVLGYWELVFAPDKFTKLDLGYVMLPEGPAGRRAFQTGGTCYSVSSSSKQQDVAFEFVKHFMGMAGWKAAAASGAPLYPPAYIPAYNEVFMEQRGPNWPVENKRINGDAAGFAVFVPRDPAWNEIATKHMAPDVELMEKGKKPVAKAFAEWSHDFTPMLTAN